MTQDEINALAIKAGFVLIGTKLHVVLAGAHVNIDTVVTKFAELILASQAQPTPSQGEPVNQSAYHGAMEDKAIWKKRALEAEEKLRVYGDRIVNLGVLAMETASKPQPTSQDAEKGRTLLTEWLVASSEFDLERWALKVRNFIEDECKQDE